MILNGLNGTRPQMLGLYHHLCLTVINYHTTSADSNLICIPTQPTSLTWFRFCFLASEVLFLAYLVDTLFSH